MQVVDSRLMYVQKLTGSQLTFSKLNRRWFTRPADGGLSGEVSYSGGGGGGTMLSSIDATERSVNARQSMIISDILI